MDVEFLGWESHITPPDEDGDQRLRGQVTIEVKGDGSCDQVVITHVVRDGSGRPVLVDTDEEDQELDGGETAQFTTRRWAKGDLEGGTGQLSVELRAATYHRVANIEMPGLGERVGDGSVVDLGDGLKLLGWGLVTDPKPDDDDEVWSNLQICVHNTGTQPVARLEVKLRMLKRSGEEVDDGRCEIDGILPGQFRGDDASLRFATRWLKKGVTAEFIIKALRVVARATAEPSELELRPR